MIAILWVFVADGGSGKPFTFIIYLLLLDTFHITYQWNISETAYVWEMFRKFAYSSSNSSATANVLPFVTKGVFGDYHCCRDIFSNYL